MQRLRLFVSRNRRYKPDIRDPRKLTWTPFDRCVIWNVDVEMLHKAVNARGVDTLDLFISNWLWSWLLDGRGEAEGTEVDLNSGQVEMVMIQRR